MDMGTTITCLEELQNENLNSQDGHAGVGIPERRMRMGMSFGAFDIENKHSEIQQAQESTSFSM
jgi:hypothetical protein